MQRDPLAHVNAHGDHQLLESHLLGVSRGTSERSAKLGLPLSGALIGLVHDLGKASLPFRNYIESFLPESEKPRHDLRGKIDHSTAGAQVIFKHLSAGKSNGRNVELAGLLALCVVSHHSGLIDCVAPDGKDGLSARLSRPETSTHAEEAFGNTPQRVLDELNRLLTCPDLLTELESKVFTVLRDRVPKEQKPGDRSHLQLGLFIRLLFSCLIDADRTDTADAEKPLSAQHRRHGQYERWEILLERLDAARQKLPCTETVDSIRRDVSDACFAAAARPAGCYTLTVPTGGGKTLSALRFALEHARIHGMERVVFVSPFISIVDQNAAVAREALEPAGVPFASVVLEHHSNVIDEKPYQDGRATTNRDAWRRKVLAENWDAPVVFTTMVQVLDALFGPGTRSVRRLHALARAVIVFDEAQTLPIKAVHLFNNAANLLTRHCGSTVLLCTATQPVLHQVNAKAGALLLAAQPELVNEKPELFAKLKRYTVHDRTNRPGGWTQAEVGELACAEATAHGSCLVVVNTKHDARTIFTWCAERIPHARLAHLSTAMCPAHRASVIQQVREWLKDSPEQQRANPILCVSTQLIEAGVDIDFGAVVRDLAGLDSLAQAAGRCNRNGKRPTGSVTLVLLPKLPKALVDIKLGRTAAQRVLDDWRYAHPDEPFPLHDPAPMEQYFEQIFYDRGHEMGYNVSAKEAQEENTLLSLLGTNVASTRKSKKESTPIKRCLLHQSFATAAENFQCIAPTKGILVHFGKRGEEVINNLLASRVIAAEWQLLREAQQYTLSVYDTQLKALERAGAVYRPASVPDLCVLQPGHYDMQFGLHNDADPMESQFV